jgi:hypothetical protein
MNAACWVTLMRLCRACNSIAEIMQNEHVDGKSLMDNPVYRDRLVALEAEVYAMKFNGMRLTTAAQVRRNRLVWRV